MSIQDEITRLETAKTDIAQSITNKGVTVPEELTLDGYASLIDQISSGGGGGTLVELARITSSGSFNPANYPSKDNKYMFLLQGGGGGGSSIGGGGAGETVITLPMTVTSQITVTIGTGGTGDTQGADGGTTSISLGYSAKGGSGSFGAIMPNTQGGISIGNGFHFPGHAGLHMSFGGSSMIGGMTLNLINESIDVFGYGYGGSLYDFGSAYRKGGNGAVIVYGYQ